MSRLLVSDAVLGALRAVHGAAVWVSVPANTRPPYSVVGKITEEPIGGKGSSAAWYNVEVIDWIVGDGRAPLDLRMAETKGALTATISFPGLEPFTATAEPGAGDELHDDGVTWAGTQIFRILGQPSG